MTKQQVQAWASSCVKADDAVRTRVVVKGVRVGDEEVAKVRFVRNKQNHVFVVRSAGKSPIRIRYADNGKFVATSRDNEVVVEAKEANKAFAKAVEQAW